MLALLLVSTAWAAPFARFFDYTQPDGTEISFWGEGDEFSAFFEHDGYTVVHDPVRNAYMYARLNGDETALIPTRLEVGKADPALNGLPQHLRPIAEAIAAQRAERFALWDAGMRVTERWQATKAAMQDAAERGLMAPPNHDTLGTKVGFTLLIDFDSDPASIPHAAIVDFLNGDDYSGYGNNGSVKEYFHDVSKGLLTYTNIVSAYVRIPTSLHSKSYYNDTSKDSGEQANKLIKDALDILRAQPNYESEVLPMLDALTLQGGEAVAFNVFYAGGNGGVWSMGLWPHAWSLYSVGAQNMGNGIKLNRYQITNIGSSLSIGTFCHENGHMLCGYPDLYDYASDGTESIGGTGNFCLMGYSPNDRNPVHVSAYLKTASGWATVTDVVVGEYVEATLDSASVTENPNAFYRFRKPGVATEYFLIENRQKIGRDASLPAAGVAIWHIDELGDKDLENREPNTDHDNFEQTLMQADGLWHLHKLSTDPAANYGDSNDLWFDGNTAASFANLFNDNTNPSANWWDGSRSMLRLENFSGNGASMTFTFQVLPPTIVTLPTLPDGYVGSPYDSRIVVNGGASPYAWTVVGGGLPSGLSLDPATGQLAGLPTAEGYYTFDVQVDGANGKSTNRVYNLTVHPPAAIPYEQNFDAHTSLPGGWSQAFISNSIPWTFRAGSGTVKPRPAAAHSGPNNARLGVQENALIGSATMLISPMIDFGDSPYAGELTFWHCMGEWVDSRDQLNVYYRTSLSDEWTLLQTFTQDTPTWTQRSIALPETSRTFYIAFEGIAKYGYGVHLDDIWIGDPTERLELVKPDWLEDAVINHFYSNLVTAVGGIPPYTFTLEDGTLPAGLALSVDGVISGTGNSIVEDLAFTVQVEDSVGATDSATFTLTVAPPRATWFLEDFESASFYKGGWTHAFVTNNLYWEVQVGGGNANSILAPQFAHSGHFNATLYRWRIDGQRPDYVTRLVSPPINLGALPGTPRLSFWHAMAELQNDQDTLRVYGRPSASASWILLATYTNDVPVWAKRTLSLPSPSSTYQLAFEGNARYGAGVCLDDIRIFEDAPAPLFRTLSPLPEGVVWVDYSASIEVAGGIAPYTFEPGGGPGLPVWLTLEPDGTLHGVPDAPGVYQFGVRVRGDDGAENSFVYSVKIRGGVRLPFAESFEAGTGLPDGWTQDPGIVEWVYRKGTPQGQPASAHTGQTNACFFSELHAGVRKKLVLPMLDLTAGVDNPRLSFWLHMKKWGNDQDKLRIYYKSSPTNSNWTQLMSITTNIAQWTQFTLDLPNPSASYMLAFEGDSGQGYGICLDDIEVTGDITASGYDLWLQDNFGANADDPLIAGPDADPDGDGVPNLWEYIFGTDPNDPADGHIGRIGIIIEDGRPLITFPFGKLAEADGVTWWLETCTDLLTLAWQPVAGSEILPRVEQSAWWEIVYDTGLPVVSEPRRFFRLKAQFE